MDFKTYAETAKEFDISPRTLEYYTLGLAGEAGEFANKVKKILRDGSTDWADMVNELGDVLWYLARAAEALNTNLNDVADRNLLKLWKRQRRGLLGGSGDGR